MNMFPHTKLLMDTLNALPSGECNGSGREAKLIKYLPDAIKIVCDPNYSHTYKDYAVTRVLGMRASIERLAFFGPAEVLMFEIAYGDELTEMHQIVSSAKSSGIKLNINQALENLLFYGESRRPEVIKVFTKAVEYYNSAEALNHIHSRNERIYRSLSWHEEEKFFILQKKLQLAVDELWIHDSLSR